MRVVKRNGSYEELDIEKIHTMVSFACENLDNVSESLVEINSQLEFYDGIKTSDIQNILVKQTNKLITLETPNYQYVAARLLLFDLYKSLFPNWKTTKIPHIKNFIDINKDKYNTDLYDCYSDGEWDIINSFIDHDRDYIFTYAGLQQLVDKYLLSNKITGAVYETPQILYILVAAQTFVKFNKAKRLHYVKRYYDALSTHKISIPTPILAGVRTHQKFYPSCVLLDMGDTVESINATNSAIVKFTCMGSGIGLNVSKLRSINDPVKNGRIKHLGIVPIIKLVESSVKAFSQISRGGSATIFYNIWNKEIEDVVVLKNNKGLAENRARNCDYAIKMSKIFYQRYIEDGEISLFSNYYTPGLDGLFGLDGFDESYIKYEKDTNIPRTTVKARELLDKVFKERSDTSRIYILNIDHANSHSPFLRKINQSNLCMEICQPTHPIGDENIVKPETWLTLDSKDTLKWKHYIDHNYENTKMFNNQYYGIVDLPQNS